MENETSGAIMIAIGCGLLLFFVVVLAITTSISKKKIITKEEAIRNLEKKRQIDLFHATATAEENEKIRIASNLHDEVIPLIALTVRNLNYQLRLLQEKGIEVNELTHEVANFSGLSQHIREIAHGLIPKLFTSFGLLKSIEAFVKQLDESSDSAAEFQNNTGLGSDLPFSQNDQLIVYRIVLEILNNLIKHAKYEYLKVTFESSGGGYTFLFAHNGDGIENDRIEFLMKTTTGIGLKSLQSRALLINAKIDYFVDQEVSFVKLEIPHGERKH